MFTLFHANDTDKIISNCNNNAEMHMYALPIMFTTNVTKKNLTLGRINLT